MVYFPPLFSPTYPPPVSAPSLRFLLPTLFLLILEGLTPPCIPALSSGYGVLALLLSFFFLFLALCLPGFDKYLCACYYYLARGCGCDQLRTSERQEVGFLISLAAGTTYLLPCISFEKIKKLKMHFQNKGVPLLDK